MKAAVLRTMGHAPRCDDFPEPVAGDGEVIVDVLAASLKPVDRQMASGEHYASPRKLPAVCGTDGVGRLSDRQRVFFGGARAPYGAMAERTVVRKAFTFLVPDGVSEEIAAALPNPGVSAWLSLVHRAKLTPGDNVLVLGATGITGTLAVKIAKIFGAARVVAAGRNRQRLRDLHQLGADATIPLDVPDDDVAAAFAHEAGSAGFQVVLDYVWGHPAEVLLGTMTRHEFAAITSETRYVQVGEAAGASISLPAAVLRSAPITIMGTAGVPPADVLVDALRQVLARGASGELHIETQRVPLAGIETAWEQDQQGKRFVVIP
jgi:NADPH:quinone reductase-like Zn-dependent oxidoreductase